MLGDLIRFLTKNYVTMILAHFTRKVCMKTVHRALVLPLSDEFFNVIMSLFTPSISVSISVSGNANALK